MIASSYEKDERKSRQLSLLLTLIGVGGFLVLAYFWVVLRGTIPPQDENPYIVVGRVDFGGVGGNPPPGPPTAVESPPSSAHPSVKEAPPPSKSENLATSPAPSPVKSPPSASSDPEPAPPAEEEEEEELETFQPGPTNQAAGGGTGTDFQFGEGAEGLQNRRLLYFILPEYKIQKEARIRFELFVLPDGQVYQVRALSLQAPPELKRAGEDAIRQWRFNSIPTNETQRMTVTIRFRLR
ncbi:MAG: hypothetical protein KatS3mg026_1512 [Bacteroidia bacterium]|nr:MAG: hypothetical protein KatS3mg026_1512 [Bacteroidia bacterium]